MTGVYPCRVGRARALIVLGLSPLFLAAPLWACTYCWPSMTNGCESVERLVVGTPTEVETFTMESPDYDYLRQARVLIEQTIIGSATPDTVTLVGPDSAQVEGMGMCRDMLANRYEVGGRYLIRLAPELTPGAFQAPVDDPDLIRLEAAPSREELVFLEYAAYVVRNHRAPLAVQFQVDPQAVTGGPVVMRLTLTNALSVPVTLIDEPDPSSPGSAGAYLGLRLLPGADIAEFADALTRRHDVEIVLAPGEERTVALDLAELYGVGRAGSYEVQGWTDVSMAPGRTYRDSWGSCARSYWFTVGPSTLVLPSGWATVKESCCR